MFRILLFISIIKNLGSVYNTQQKIGLVWFGLSGFMACQPL